MKNAAEIQLNIIPFKALLRRLNLPLHGKNKMAITLYTKTIWTEQLKV